MAQLLWGQGIHSLVPMHTTHKHIEGFIWVQGKESLAEAWHYVTGRTKPHYPVPSIYCFTLISNKCDDRSNDIAINLMLFDMAMSCQT